MKTQEELLEIAKNEEWYWISGHQTLSEEFIEEFEDKIDWKNLIRSGRTFSKDFVWKHLNKFDLKYLT